MSVRLATPESDECSYDDCDDEYLLPNAKAGSYCSRECAERDTATDVLEHLRRDHRICGVCWRLRKDVEQPSDNYRRRFSQLLDEAVVGYEVPTRHVTDGPYGLVCGCGAVDHNFDAISDDADDEEADALDGLRQFTPFEWTLYLAIEAVRERGEWEYTFDIETFCETIWETDDLELAVGRAIC